MMSLFNFFGNIFGYLLWFLYVILHNYGMAIFFFTLVTKLLVLPLSIKQQRSMSAQSKLMARQRELQQKYANDREKLNAEMQKLYAKENFNPMSGCLTSLLPFPIMLGIYYSVLNPLRNTLHLAADSVARATEVFSRIPGMAVSGANPELDVLRYFPALKDYLTANGIFTANEVARIESFNQGFRFFGWDLLATPQQSSFTSMLWLIPVLCLLSYWAMQFVTSRMMGQGNQQGCTKIMFLVLPLLSAYWAYIMPAAVGLYWVFSSVLQLAQTYILHKIYSPAKVTAYDEAAHLLWMEQEEKKVLPLPADVQAKLAEKLAPKEKEDVRTAGRETGGSRKKRGGKNSGSASDYMGTKK